MDSEPLWLSLNFKLRTILIMAKQIGYAEAIAEIEETIAKIEGEELDVDEITQKVKRVSFLLTLCREKLRNTEAEVDKILKEMEKGYE